MQISKSMRFDKIWLVVPCMTNQLKELELFLENHSWLFQNGGHLILKASGVVDQVFVEQVTTKGVLLLQQTDISLYDAWNQAMDYLCEISVEDGAYVAFLGLDDSLSLDFCSDVALLAHGNEKIDFIYGNSRHLFQGRYFDFVAPIKPALFGKSNFTFDVTHPGMMHRWETICKYRFDTQFKLAADFDFYVGIAQKQTISFKKIDVIQAEIGAAGVSNGLKAKSIYLKEWKEIERKRGVKLNLQLLRNKLNALLAIQPHLFRAIRKLWWMAKASKY